MAFKSLHFSRIYLPVSATITFYIPVQLRNKCRRRSDHTDVWVPAHEIESALGGARWNARQNSKKFEVFFLFLFSLPPKWERDSRRWTPQSTVLIY